MKRSLRSWLWRVPLDQEVDEELAFHVEMRTRELIERGLDAKTAREMAISRFGDLARLKRTCVDLGRKRDRDMRLTRWLDEFRNDVKFAVRQLRTSPDFTFIAVVTLALGIGANSATFALVDATLLRPLPFRDPDRLVMVWERTETLLRGSVAPLNLLDWNDQNRTFEKMAGFIPGVGGMVMAGADGTAETVPRQWVTTGIFDVLGITPVAGRTFVRSDESPQSGAVVLSEAFWRSRFGGDPTVIGHQIRLDGMPFVVVGVVPQNARLLGSTSIWALIVLPRTPNMRAPRFLQVIGRLKPGVTLDAAGSDMTAVAEGLARAFPQTNKGRGVRLERLHEAMVGGELRLTSLLFLGVVGFVLLICCANVANLLLARASIRARELAVRSALGAGRRRIVRQLLTESLVLAVLGGALGAFVGAAILKVAPSMVPQDLLPGSVTLTFNTRVVGFCAGAALLVGVLFGLAPAWQATGLSAAQVMSSSSRTVTARGGTIRSLLVVGEVATAVLLLVGAGLLLRTLLAVGQVDRGYRADSVLTMMVDPLGSQYPSPDLLQQFFNAVDEAVLALPGVRSVAWASTLPLGPSDAGGASFEIVGGPPLDEGQRPTADFQIVSPTYFQALDLPIVAGRRFDNRDTRGVVQVCIVNEAFVRGYLQGRSPIGVRIATRPATASGAQPVVREIVGVARQVKGRPDEVEDLIQVYVPLAQNLRDDMYLVVRPSSGTAESLAPSVRAAIARVDRDQLVSVRDVMTLDDVEWEATGHHRFRAVMVMTFAGLALLLALVGVFGILAYSVQQRVREFGVRIALGATVTDVLGLVIRSAVRLIVAGTVIGLSLAAVLGRLLATVLFGVQPLDPLTFGSVIVLLALTAAAATTAPALRAARIDPALALRSD
jgi:putative ABC transport system permease protein